MNHRCILTILMCAFVSGCLSPNLSDLSRFPATGPRPPSRPPETDGLQFEKQPAPESLRVLTLEQAFDLAERLHPELALARARVEAAGGRALQAGIFPNPQAVARMESAPFRGGTTGEAEYPLGISQRLPLGRRLSAAARVEELDRERLAREFESRRTTIRARVHGDFATALYLDQVIRAQAEALQISDNAVAAAKARMAAGDAVPEDVARVEMEQLRARLELERAGSLRDQALVALTAAIGAPRLRIESLEGALDQTLEVPALELLAARLAESPFLTAAEADIEVQRARLDLAQIERIPDVNLDLFYRRLEHSEKDAFDVGISLPIPIFDRNQGRIREAQAEVAVAVARARSTRNNLEERLLVSHAALVRALANARVLREQILPRADALLKAAEARYAAGDASLTDVLPVRRDHTSVQLSYLESLRQVMEAWALLSPYVQER